jgi:hypothetical protein
MTGGEAADIDRVIDASFYSQGFPGPERLKAVHILHVAGDFLCRHSWSWARAGPQKLIESGLAPHLLLSFLGFPETLHAVQDGFSRQITGTAIVNR